jgi:alanyl aminopeptidase
MKTTIIASVLLSLSIAGSGIAMAEITNDPYRLDVAVQPLSQQLEMTLDPNALRYAGETLIALDIREEVESVRLHAQDLTIISARFGPEGALSAAQFDYLEHALLEISTGSAITPGQYELQIEFEDDFNTDSVSMYRVKENGRNHVFSQMEASEAREAFPCFDEPAYKIPWQSAPMPSYLVAIAVGDFETVEIPGMSIPGRVVTTRGKSALTELAVESTPKLLAGLENYFDTQYPYQKLDLVATPEFWYGAMENPGAIVYLDRAILIDPDNADATRFRSIVGTNSHELAHQWFGDVVTMEWWVDLWLNESFASWMGDKIVAQTYPQLDIEKSRMSAMFKTMALDSRASSRPIRAPRSSTDNFLNDIGPAYSKGRIVINMFEKAIGEEKFRAGILDYMQRHKWGNATAVDFADAIGLEANFDVPKAFESFMHQPGIPQIEVEVVGDGRLAVSQRRFTNAQVELTALQWTIPLTIKYAVDGTTHTQSLLLDDLKQVVELEHSGDLKWIYPNADQSGYYRWKLPSKFLQPLLDDAQELLTPMERMGLVSNLTAMLNADNLDADEYLAALETFSTERDPYVLNIVIDQLVLVRDALVSADQKRNFATMVSRLLGPALQSMGMDPTEDESNALTTVRPRLLEWMMRDARDRATINEFSRRAEAFLTGDSNLHSSLVPAALLAAAIDGDEKTYRRFKDRFENATTPTERAQLLVGLTDFEATEILVDLQSYSVGEAVRPREIITVREKLIERPDARELVFNHMLGNYPTFQGRLPGNGLAVLPSFAKSCSLSSAERAAEFFNNPDHQVSGTLRILDTTSAAIKSCAAIRDREIENADRYFRSVAAD